MSSNNSNRWIIDEHLQELFSGDVPAEVEQRLQQHLAAFRGRLKGEQEIRPQRLRFRHWRTSSLVTTAASVAILCSIWFAISSSTPSLYAQAIAAVRAAKTVHATATRYKNGIQTGSAEIWYDAERGVREQQTQGDATSFRLDNGEFEWIYRASPNTVIKRPSRDPIGEIEDVLRPLEEIDKVGAKRAPDLDATIRGESCRAFASVLDKYTPPMRIALWLDGHDRLVRFDEQIKIDGKWTLDERAEVRYDVPIPPKLFVANFPTDARIIDRTDSTTTLEVVKLADSLATAERLGIVLAIHEVRRVDDDTVFVMSTSRASQKVIDRFGQIDSQQGRSSKVYGAFTWSTNGRRLPDHTWLNGMKPIRLANWRKDGIDYQWVLLKKRQATEIWIENDGSLQVGFYVHTRAEWQEALKAEGKTWWLQNEKDVVTLDVPAESEGLESILADIHEQTLAIVGATTGEVPTLCLKSIPYTREEIEEEVASGESRATAERLLRGRASNPQNISLDEWLKEVRAMVAD